MIEIRHNLTKPMYVGLIESISPLGPQRMGQSENCVTDQRVLSRGRCTWEDAAAVNLFPSGTGKSRQVRAIFFRWPKRLRVYYIFEDCVTDQGVRAIFSPTAEKAEILLHDKTEAAEALWDFEL